MKEPESVVPEPVIGDPVIGDQARKEAAGVNLRWMADLLRRAPWMAASVLFHFALLLAATVIGFRLEKPLEQGRIEVNVADAATAKPPVFPSAPARTEVKRNGLPAPTSDPAAEDPRIDFPDATLSDHNESADGEDFHKMKGPSIDFLSSLAGPGGGIRGSDSSSPGLYDALGTGAGRGAPSRHGGPWGGQRNLVSMDGPTRASEGAVLAGLRWLARHQSPDGRWSTDRFSDSCGARPSCAGPGSHDHDAGLTGLALLAFLGAGYLPRTRGGFEDPFRRDPGDPARPLTVRFGEVVLKGLRWLAEAQDAEGCFPKQEGEFMYDHAIATLAMAEAAWLAPPFYRGPAQRGIDFLVRAQNPGRAWRYSVRPGDNDTSVTGWAVMALKSAELAGLPFPPESYQGARQWLRSVTSVRGVVGYESPGDPGSVLTGVNEKWMGHPAMTAVGLLIRIFVDRRRDPWMEVAAASIVRDPPIWDTEHKTVDYYYWYYAALALFQYDGPHGKFWRAFNEQMKKALVENQAHATRPASAKSCADGSWDPSVDRWGSIGGRVYATAINTLTLEVYYRYEHVFGARKR